MEPSATGIGYLKRLGNQGNPKEKILQTGLLDHCIFCLQKTGGGGGGPDDVVVPIAFIRPRFIQSFNEVWQHLRNLKRIAAKTNLLSPEIPQFSVVPTMCQSCANLTQYVAELLQNLRLRVGQLKGVIIEARERGGEKSGRFENFERNLKESTIFGGKDDHDHIQFILKFIETLDSNPVGDENIQANQPGEKRKGPSKRKLSSNSGSQGHQVEIPSNVEETSTSRSSTSKNNETVIKIENEEGDVVMEFHPEPEDKEVSEKDSDSDYNPSDDDAAQNDSSASDQEEENSNLSSNNYNQATSASAQNQEMASINDDDYTLAGAYSTTFQDIFICEHKGCGKTFIGKGAYTHHKSIFHSEKNLKFTCSTPTCGRKFRTETLLKEHMKKNQDTHPEYHVLFSKFRYPCDMCGDPLTLSQEQAEEHLKTHLGGTDEYIVKCPIDKCLFVFTNHTAALYHLKIHKRRNEDTSKIGKDFGLTCETCGHVGANRQGLAGHVTRCHERGEDSDKQFNCPVESCGERYYVRQSVDLHLEKHRLQNVSVTKQRCEVCKEEIKVEEMEDHLRNVHQIITEILKCDQCPCVYSSGKGLLEHLFEHRKSSCLYCFICKDGEKYGKHSDLRWHFEKEHQIDCSMHSCELCERKFFTKGVLATHVKWAHKKQGKKELKKYKCDECPEERDVRFSSEEHLITHKIRCHGAVPFKCEECEETFSSLVVFKRHKKEHLGILAMKKEWKCEEEGCGKVYPNRGKLRLHKKRTHGGEKNWVCDSCGKAFFDRASLKIHNDGVHLGLRPWVCEECGESFRDSGVLRTHRLIHTGERPYGCEICGQRFRHIGVLRTHLEGHQKKGEAFKPNGPMKNIRKRKAQ